MIVASLPFSPFLFHGIFEAFLDLSQNFKENIKASETLYIFSLCWLGAVLFFFSVSATKLPSYWLPATPAAAILISNSFSKLKIENRNFSFLWILNIFIFFGFSIAFFFSNTWLSAINDPEMPNLAENLISSGIIFKARLFFSLVALFSLTLFLVKSINALLYIQILLLLGQSFLMPQISKLGDTSRQLPLRNISKLISKVREGKETLAMVGVRKPSLHYYTKQIVFYEPSNIEGLINLSERLTFDRRENYQDKPNYENKSLLVVIDKYSSRADHWSTIMRDELGQYGIYYLWRVKKSDLNNISKTLVNNGYQSDWKYRKVEKF